jgi:2-polyprenyl-3-methyl-5-hydroxy-6-metoxy-1,4-benzoquinol methylase
VEQLEKITACPICSNKEFVPFLATEDFTVSRETFTIVKCKNCGFAFTNPRPKEESIGKYYESEDYISHSNTKAGLINKIYHIAKKSAIQSKLKLIDSLNTERILLDIGCGTGAFLGAAKANGWKTLGIEPNGKARELAQKDFKLEVYPELIINQFENSSISIITMWHVLEHVHRLEERITEIYTLLKPGGFAIIAVPNYNSWDARHYKKYWAGYDVPRHLYHFSPDNIKTLFNKHFLKHIKSNPMKLDSYYVSMLSEKYKESRLGILKAMINGFYSNTKAQNNPEKYSSVIYIFQK